MYLKVVRNFYAPKHLGIDDIWDHQNSHMVVSPKCNFRCIYCNFWDNPNIDFKEISSTDFDLLVRFLLKSGQRFKFTGGEPCLNPNIFDLLAITKQHGGKIYLDSNGSIPDVLLGLVEDHLVDIVGLSLKGLTPNEAIATSGILSKSLAWDNPLTAIESVLEASSSISVLITHVFYNTLFNDSLDKFADILEPFGPRVILKVNNIIPNERNYHLKCVPNEILLQKIQNLADRRPKWKNRIVIVDSREAIKNKSSIRFM
jgi:MoaA/NifB/PqqE/SkfB family radical SAM enzyme